MNEQLESHKSKYICINRKTLRLLLNLIVLLIIGICIHKCIKLLEDSDLTINRTIITNGRDSIFITYYVGGLLGDVHKLLISDRILTGDKVHFINYNPDSVFVLVEDLPIFYKFYNDTLLLYVNEMVKEPKHFESKIKVVTYDIDNEKSSYPELRKQYKNSLKKIENNGNVLSMPY